jgi:phage tail tape-measure protein
MVRNAFLSFLSLATLVAVPSSAWAQEGAAAGAAAGAVNGGVVGGPVGAAVGGAAGAAAGSAADQNRSSSTTVVREAPAPTTSERTCVRDAAGNETCREVTR